MMLTVNDMARIAVCSGLAMLSAVPARAGDWSVAAQGTITSSYDDNIRMSAANTTAGWTGTGQVGAQLQFRDDTVQWRLSPRVRTVRYDNDRTLNRTEYYTTLLGQLASERGSFSVTLNGTQDTTLTSELGLTGFAEANKKHRTGSVSVSNSYSTSERLDVSAQIFASVNRYIDAERTGLVDYDFGSTTVGASYELSERSALSLQMSAGKLQAPDLAQRDKTNYSVNLGYAVKLTPRWNLDLSAGPSRISTATRNDNGSVYDVTLTNNSERATFNLSATRDVTPTGQGALSRREQLRLGLDNALGPRWSTGWSISVVRNRDLLSAGGLEQSVTYGDVAGNLTWLETPAWNISLSGGYTQQRVGSGQPRAERRHAGLNISWNGPARRLN